jgi:glycosyltransferase involved in cell wall biosynthesis
MDFKLIITLPCCNEEAFIRTAYIKVKGEIKKLSQNYLIILAEDGSTDKTFQIAKEISRADPNTILIHSDRKLGRGRALKEAWRRFDGDIYVYLDCDMATDISAFPMLFEGIQEGYDLVTGSRYLKESKVHRPFLRFLVSIVYNWIIRTLFNTGVLDHQCGFKSFSKRLIKTLLSECKSDGWFWDTEIIVKARRRGFRIKEVPIKWTERRWKRTPIKRLVKDIWIHSIGIINLIFSE